MAIENQLLRDVRVILKQVQDYVPAEYIVRQEQLGEYNFGELVPEIEPIVSLSRQIPADMLTDLTSGQVNEIYGALNQFAAVIRGANDFNLKGENPKAAHEKIVMEMRKIAASVANVLMPYAAYGISQSAGFQELKEEAKKAVSGMREASDKFEEEVKEKRASIEISLDMAYNKARAEFQKAVEGMAENAEVRMENAVTARENVEAATAKRFKEFGAELDNIEAAVSTKTVEKQAEHFKMLADNHENIAENWCGFTIAAAVLLVGFAVGSIFMSNLEVMSNYPIQSGISKVLVFTVLGYALFFCAKNYGAHRHNAVVNRHRENALRTFRVLAATTHSAENRDIVLNQAAQCIFGPRDSGYIRGGNSGGDGISINANIPRFPGAKVDD